MTVRYLDLETVIAINALVGGEGGDVRELSTADSSVARPMRGLGNVLFHPTIWDKAAASLCGLASTQGLHDGNERTACTACRVFLELNEHQLAVVEPVDGEVSVLAVSASLVDIETIAEWMHEHAVEVAAKIRRSELGRAPSGQSVRCSRHLKPFIAGCRRQPLVEGHQLLCLDGDGGGEMDRVERAEAGRSDDACLQQNSWAQRALVDAGERGVSQLVRPGHIGPAEGAVHLQPGERRRGEQVACRGQPGEP